MSSLNSGTAMPVCELNACITSSYSCRALKFPDVGDAARDRARGRCRGTDEMRAYPRPLAVLEVAVGGGHDALARLAAVAIAAGAHRAARLAPKEPCVAEHAVEACRLR